jgi:hypothetical protein
LTFRRPSKPGSKTRIGNAQTRPSGFCAGAKSHIARARALAAAAVKPKRWVSRVDLGDAIEGEARLVARAHAGFAALAEKNPVC